MQVLIIVLPGNELVPHYSFEKAGDRLAFFSFRQLSLFGYMFFSLSIYCSIAGFTSGTVYFECVRVLHLIGVLGLEAEAIAGVECNRVGDGAAFAGSFATGTLWWPCCFCVRSEPLPS